MVDRPGREAALTDDYREVREHYGTLAMPARPGRPWDTGAVEAAVGLVERAIRALPPELNGRPIAA